MHEHTVEERQTMEEAGDQDDRGCTSLHPRVNFAHRFDDRRGPTLNSRGGMIGERVV